MDGGPIGPKGGLTWGRISSKGGLKKASDSRGSKGGPRGPKGLIPGRRGRGPKPRGWNINGPIKQKFVNFIYLFNFYLFIKKCI